MANISRERKVRFSLPEVSAGFSRRSNSHVVNSYKDGCLVSVAKPTMITPRSVSYARRPVATQSLRFNTDTVRSSIQKPQIFHRTPATNATRIENLKKQHIVIVTEPTTAVRKFSYQRSLPPSANVSMATISNRFSRLMLVDDIVASKPPPVIIPLDEPPPRFQGDTYPRNTVTVRRIAKSLFNAETNARLVADLVNRWHRMRYKEKLQSRHNISGPHQKAEAPLIHNIYGNQPLTDSVGGGGGHGHGVVDGAVCILNRSRSDAKRFGSFKMSLEGEQDVTTLLRAAREADEELLKIVLRKILIDGISKEALNAADKSGRTAISYICSTNLTYLLDIILQIPGIDVNKSDNEGNTPLHFAAQAGQADIVNMLITRSRSLQVDAKNVLGFTPLMKAAVQGRTRCAKLLLFAGGSPLETDYGRGFRAEQWAAFCGRQLCAEIIEKCARARLLEKTQSCRTGTTEFQQKVPVSRSKTTNIQTQIGESFRATFRKFLPFGSTLKGRQTTKELRTSSNNNNNTDLVGYLKSATICASGPALPTGGKAQILSNLTRTFEVPKVEVTPANNQYLIKKYETKLNHEQADIPVVKASASVRY